MKHLNSVLIHSISLVLSLAACQRQSDIRFLKDGGGVAEQDIFADESKEAHAVLKRETEQKSQGIRGVYGDVSYSSYTSYQYPSQYQGYGGYTPSYGYSQNYDPAVASLLALGDYLRYSNPKITNILRLRLAYKAGQTVAVGSAIDKACWDLTLTSDRTINNHGSYQYPGNPPTITDSSTTSRHIVLESPMASAGVMLFSLSDQNQGTPYCSGFDPLSSWYGGGTNPYQSGYNGYYGGQYYYYPPVCGSPFQASSLRLRGTLKTSCGQTGQVVQNVDVDLSSYLNSYPGYAPYFRTDYTGGARVSGRTVTYDKQDFYTTGQVNRCGGDYYCPY